MIDGFPVLSFPDISKQAVSKARQGINPEAFAELFRISVMEYYSSPTSLRTWNGYHVHAIDGTTLQVPRTEMNLPYFGSASNQCASTCAVASGSICFDVLNDIVVDAAFKSYCYGGQKMARMHLRQMGCHGFRRFRSGWYMCS